MRPVVGLLFWWMVGLLALFPLVSVAGNSVWRFLLLIPAALALFGTWWPGLRYSGAALIAFGMYPALLISGLVLGQVVNADWSCSRVAFDGISNPNGGNTGCTVVSIDLIFFGAGPWMVAFFGALLLFRLLRAGSRTPPAHPPTTKA